MDGTKPQAANKSTPSHNLAMAKDFLAGLDPSAKKFDFQLVRGGKRTSIVHGTLEEFWPAVEKLNTSAHGADVFVLPNGVADRQPRTFFAAANNNEQINSALAAITAYDAKPNMTVEDGGRLRLCYPCSDIPPDQYATSQKRLNAALGVDATSTNLSRVPLPGTLRFDNPAKPRLVELRRNGAGKDWTFDDLIGRLEKLPRDINIHTMTVTFFPNKSAQSQHCIALTLPQLAEQIQLKTGPSKLELPWLKLAVFGDKRSNKNCLRTNANLEQITGIEVEHDKGEIGFDTAIATLRTAKLRALVYTSPSYVPAVKERWRILLPLTSKLSPEERALLVARVNGLFDGKLAPESFDLSRSFLYGSVNANPAHRVEVINGDFIDLRNDLDQGAIGRPPTGKEAKPNPAFVGASGQRGEGGSEGGHTDAEIMTLLERSRHEHEWHNAMLSATASMVGRGWTNDQIYQTCAPYCWGGEDDADVEEMVEGARAKWNIPDGPAAERLARLTLLEYDQQRKEAAKALGVRVAVLDNMVGACRTHNQTEDVDSEIAEINADHALVLAGNKAAVMKFEGKTKFRLLQISAFTQWFANQSVMIGRKSVSLGDYWLSHPQRRQYDGIEFAPPGSVIRPGHYNLWQGFAVEPREGDCSKFLAHLKDNAARGDENTYRWIVGWWAQILQHPSIKMETALVMRGPFGAGKTKIGEVMGSLIGDHYLLVSQKRHIVGQFNSHMASLLVLHPDEAFWAGDKESVGTVRDLVTGKTYRLEYKGVDIIVIKSFVRLYVSGNPNWVVPAGFKERRWAVFDIGEDHVQDHPYFAAIDHEMDNGGREALLHYLLNFDLKQVDLRTIPKTAALLHQQIETMTSEEAWWFETLRRGVLPLRPPGTNESGVCPKDLLFERYIQHARIQGVSHRSTETKIGLFLNKQLGRGLQHPRPQGIRCYKLPSLADCRRLFSEELGQSLDWGVADWASEEWQHGHANWPIPFMG
jgi:hypothetical protein